MLPLFLDTWYLLQGGGGIIPYSVWPLLTPPPEGGEVISRTAMGRRCG